jgi:hypothetical protein
MINIVPRWEKATNELINKLESKGIDFNKFSAIELFGRDGSWQTKLFGEKVNKLEVWEINKKFEKELRKNIPKSKIKIINSIKALQENKKFQLFDLILIDNPNNTYGNNDDILTSEKYCEHFDILGNIGKLINKEALVIFNVNRNPFNYSKFPDWKKRREIFYGIKNTENITIEKLLIFYEKFFKKIGFETIFHVNVIRVYVEGNDTNHYFAFQIKKIN